MLSKLKEQVNNASDQVSTSIKQAQESNINMSKQISQANQTMKLASLVNKDAEKLQQGVSQAQRKLVPLMDKVNDTLAQGNEMIDQSKKEFVKQIDKGNDFIEQKKNEINQKIQEQKQEFEKKGSENIKKIQNEYFGETPTDDGNNGQGTQIQDAPRIEKNNKKQEIAKQTPQDKEMYLANQDFNNYQQIEINQGPPQTIEDRQDQLQDCRENSQQETQQSNKNRDYSRTSLGNDEEKVNKKTIGQRRQEIQNKIKSYMKKITGKQVNSRIEYLCLLSQKMRNNDDNQLLCQSRNILKDNIWQCAQQERRILSHQNIYEYMSKVLEFMFEYLTIIETVFQQLKMRFKSSNRSFHILDNFLSGLITQLEYYETYSYVKQNESILSLMFTRKARGFQKEKKKPNDLQIEAQNQMFHPKLCETFCKIEDQFKNQLIGVNSIKQIIRSEYKEKLQQCYQENKQKLEDYFVQVQGQRNITFQVIEEFYQSFQKYDQIYEQNSRAILNQTQITRDLYDEEYKTLHTFRYLIKQQQQFGIFTTYLLTELQQFEQKRILVIKDVLSELSKKCSQYFISYQGFEQQFQDPLIIQQSKTAFDISNLVSQDQLNIIRKYAVLKQDAIVTHEIYNAFATNFKIPEPISTLESHPLIIKQYTIMRDVAWERSLSFGKDLIPCQCIVTVDGFVLFYDSDIHYQGQEYAQYSNYQLPIKDLNMKERKDDSLIELIVTNKGKIFDTHKKQIIKFDEQLSKESLEIVINQFK